MIRLITCFFILVVAAIGMNLTAATQDSILDETEGEKLKLPYDLIESAKSHGCEPVAGFYNRQGTLNPPYVYGVFGGDRSKSVAYWCQSTNKKSAKPIYKLVFVNKENRSDSFSDIKFCPAVIEQNDFPGGLSLITDDSEYTFTYNSSPYKVAGKFKASIDSPFIETQYDGDGMILVCLRNEGKWAFKGLH